MRFYRVNALLLKYFYITRNRLDRIFDLVYWPIIDLFAWGFATFFIKELSGVNVLSMILGGVILWVFVWRSSQDIAVYVLEDFWSRNLYNLFTSPVRASEVTLSVIIFGSIRSIFTFFFLVLLSWALYSFNIFIINIFYIALFVSILTLIGWVMGLFISSIIFRYGSRIQVFAWSMVWVIQPFSCIFYPLSVLPAWAQKIAIVLPTTHIFEALRAVVNNQLVNWNGIFYSIVVSFVLLIIVSIYLRFSIKHARKIGLFARYE